MTGAAERILAVLGMALGIYVILTIVLDQGRPPFSPWQRATVFTIALFGSLCCMLFTAMIRQT